MEKGPVLENSQESGNSQPQKPDFATLGDHPTSEQLKDFARRETQYWVGVAGNNTNTEPDDTVEWAKEEFERETLKSLERRFGRITANPEGEIV